MNKSNKESFLEKYKTDKKYKAKIQLIGYGAFIILLIVYLNIASLNTTSHGNIVTLKNNTNQLEEKETEEKRSNLLKQISDNYEYEIKVSLTQEKDDLKSEVTYNGKRFKNNMEITKKTNNENTNYYKVDSKYYTKEEDKYQLSKEETIYNLIEKEYIELEEIKEYIEKASLDHITEYSNGIKEYVYHLKVKDIVKSYPETEEIEINITEEKDILTIKIDYTNLIKITKEDKIAECKVEYQYKNINKIEEFTIIEEQKSDTQNNNQ